jgi:hypothetical protein
MNFMFNLEEYTTVRERIIEFWKRFPNGRIETEILEWSDKRFIVAARLYREMEDSKPFSTGLAHEAITDKGVNKDFALENGATSSIGIACSNANIGIDKHKPSREEMQKVVSRSVTKPAVQDLVQAIKSADAEPAEQDYWTTPVNEYMKVVDAPVTLEKAMQTVTQVMGTAEAAEVPQCKHGSMVWKEGHSTKTGKDWAAYQCTALGHSGFEGKCPAIWYEINSAGKWQPQKARG